jgi:hypothetical protein
MKVIALILIGIIAIIAFAVAVCLEVSSDADDDIDKRNK